eukprot:gb/GECG01003184.1/.p1 GENE.gb/GECG01003184.1/~~gb/GECG01003184.1/.p1  ORF type:complete len:167 (+),score=34.87 gb/GECG01003184.1/:1-501(+)
MGGRVQDGTVNRLMRECLVTAPMREEVVVAGVDVSNNADEGLASAVVEGARILVAMVEEEKKGISVEGEEGEELPAAVGTKTLHHRVLNVEMQTYQMEETGVVQETAEAGAIEVEEEAAEGDREGLDEEIEVEETKEDEDVDRKRVEEDEGEEANWCRTVRLVIVR